MKKLAVALILIALFCPNVFGFEITYQPIYCDFLAYAVVYEDHPIDVSHVANFRTLQHEYSLALRLQTAHLTESTKMDLQASTFSNDRFELNISSETIGVSDNDVDNFAIFNWQIESNFIINSSTEETVLLSIDRFYSMQDQYLLTPSIQEYYFRLFSIPGANGGDIIYSAGRGNENGFYQIELLTNTQYSFLYWVSGRTEDTRMHPLPLDGSRNNELNTSLSFSTSPVPEPATIILFGFGFLGLIFKRKLSKS